MSLHNFLPPNRDSVGYKVFPVPNKSIRLDDPNYIHYVPTEPIFGDRFEADRKDDTTAYNAPTIDERTILRTHVSVSSYRRSFSGSLSSPLKSSPSPSKERDVRASFQTPSPKETEVTIRSSQEQHSKHTTFQPPAEITTPPATPESNSVQVLEAGVIRPEDSNLLEHFHVSNSLDDDGALESSNTDVKASESEQYQAAADGEDHLYAMIQPRDQRANHGQQEEERAIFGENEYDVAIGAPPMRALMVDDKSETTHTSTLTFTSIVSDEEFPRNQAETKINTFASGFLDELQQELKQVTRSVAIQMKSEALSKKEQEVQYEREKAKTDYTAEKFLHEIPNTDMYALELTQAQRLDLAQKLADKRRAEREAELEAEFEEWKRVNDIEIPSTVRRSPSP